MILFRKPPAHKVAEFLASQRTLSFSYDAVGATEGTPPAGFTVDHTRGTLGRGEETFASACAALRRWRQFQLGWLEAIPASTPHEVGQVIAVVAHFGLVYWLNACRIVVTIDDDGPLRRYGFAYGTLPDHAECGEERFLIEWERATGDVVYDILAFSRPRHPLARLGYPLVRLLQKRFARQSVKAMQRL